MFSFVNTNFGAIHTTISTSILSTIRTTETIIENVKKLCGNKRVKLNNAIANTNSLWLCNNFFVFRRKDQWKARDLSYVRL